MLLSDTNDAQDELGGYGEVEKKIVRYSPSQKKIREISWTPIQLINAFKELNKVTFFASNAKLLKNLEMEKLKSAQFSFAPIINQQSQVLAETQLKKYLETSMSGGFHENGILSNLPSITA